MSNVAALRKVSSHWILKTIDSNHHFCFSIVWGFGYRANSLRILHQLLHDPISKKYTVNQGCLSLSTYILFGVWPSCCATPPSLSSPSCVRAHERPRAIRLPMITMRKSIHGFLFPYGYGYGGRWSSARKPQGIFTPVYMKL